MEPIITEQIEKFQSGDFSGYESFYYATSQTVYTMLHTIIPDENTAAELMPKVYEKIYANVQTLPQTEAFYAWSAKLANEEALEYLKGNTTQAEMDVVNAQTMESADSSSDMPFYDYAAEDEALAITEDLSEDRVFTEHVQAVIEALSPMEKVVFQSYYYFGESVPAIVEKTGCTTRAVKHTIGQTRTALLSAITAYGQAPAYAVQQEKSHKFGLKDTPWMYILFQNYIGKVTGIAHVGITGSAAGAIAMVGQAGGVAGTSAVIGQAGGIAGTTAGQAGSAAKCSGNRTGRRSYRCSSESICKGKRKIPWYGWRKSGSWSCRVAAVVGIGLGIHHASSEPERHIVAIEEEDGNGALMWEDGPAPEVETEQTEEETMPENEDEQQVKSQLEVMLEQARTGMEDYATTGKSEYSDYYTITTYSKENSFYALEDIDEDGEDELLFGCWNSEKRMVEIRDICNWEYHPEARYGNCYYSEGNVMSVHASDDQNYDLVYYDSSLEDDYSCTCLLELRGRDGVIRYYELGYGAQPDYFSGPIEVTYDTFLQQLDDDYQSLQYTEIDESTWAGQEEAHSYKKLSWKPMFEDETILNDDPSIPDADGKF
ncbi:MAG: RNA polymerase sigma factor [Coprococcus sp.]